MRNGQLLETKGKGTIVVQTKKGTNHIRDVFLDPNLKQNLLSAGQFNGALLSFLFENDNCRIFDKGRSTDMITSVKIEKIRKFPLKFPKDLDVVLKMEIDDESALWYKNILPS